MRIFISIAAILGWFFGAALLFVPVEFYKPTGIVMTPMIATLPQAHGATLIGLSLVNWLARDADKKGLTAILAGNLLVQILSLYVVLLTMSLGAGSAVAPGIVIHVVLGSFFGFFLYRNLRA
jgi:hypothetical protein